MEFRQDFLHKKTSDSWLSYGVVCVIIHLAILIQCWLVMDGQMDGHTTTAYTALA